VEKDGEPLSLGKQCEGDGDTRCPIIGLTVIRPVPGLLVWQRLGEPLPTAAALADRAVHDHLPEPRLGRAFPTEPLACSDRGSECLLHNIAGGLTVADDGTSDAAEPVKLCTVDLLNLRDRKTIRVRSGHLST
jgi:hypothetical protein